MSKTNKILITGLAGYLGRLLLPHLEQDAEIQEIVGIDCQPLPANISSSKLTFYQLDIRDPQIEPLFAGVDTVVHLAFVLMRTPGDNEVDDINTLGSRHVFETAATQGVRKLVVPSSVVAYGLHPDNPIPLTEESALRPNPGLYYSRDKAANEAYLDEFQQRYPEMIITRLRPCTVIGPRAKPALMASFLNERVILVKGFDPPYQLLHEEDLVSALALVIRHDLPGVYNVTSDEPATLSHLTALRKGKVTTLPYALARSIMALLWRMGKTPFAPEWIDLSCYPLIASNEKLKRAGWKPQYTTVQAYMDLLKSHGIYISEQG